METAAFLLLLIGCSDDLGQCKELPAPAPAYENSAECEAVLPSEMKRHMEEFPQILAKCVAFDPALEQKDAEVTWRIDGTGDLLTSIESSNQEELKVARNGG